MWGKWFFSCREKKIWCEWKMNEAHIPFLWRRVVGNWSPKITLLLTFTIQWKFWKVHKFWTFRILTQFLNKPHVTHCIVQTYRIKNRYSTIKQFSYFWWKKDTQEIEFWVRKIWRNLQTPPPIKIDSKFQVNHPKKSFKKPFKNFKKF
jgi:hypothetical protein